MTTKTCKRCGTAKLADEFYGGDSSCKECRKIAVNLYRKNNLEKIRAYDVKRGKQPHRKALTAINTRKRRQDPDGYMAAHNAVAKALKKGTITRLPCAMCGSTGLVHAHHDDYSLPLDVIWLCVVHHKSRHAFLEYIKNDIF